MNKVEATASLAKAMKSGFNPLVGGLGLVDGEYSFVTPNNDDIFTVKEVTSKKDGRQWAITLVAGTATGIGELNKSVSQTFGIGEKDRQLGVTLDQWNLIQPNQKYTMVITNGRVNSILIASEMSNETLAVDAESDEEKAARKAAKKAKKQTA